MRNYFLLFLLAIITSCQQEDSYTPFQSHLDLENDYENFYRNMTSRDTIIIRINLSLCMFHGRDSLTITKRNDSLKIETHFRGEGVGFTYDAVHPKIIAVNDTTWKFDHFLIKNSHRRKPGKSRYSSLLISTQDQKLKLYAHGLGDKGRFFSEYSKTMKNIFPKSEYYFGTIDAPPTTID